MPTSTKAEVVVLHDVKSLGSGALEAELALLSPGTYEQVPVSALAGSTRTGVKVRNVTYVCGEPEVILKLGSTTLEEVQETLLELGGHLRIKLVEVEGAETIGPKLVKELKYNGYQKVKLDLTKGEVRAEAGQVAVSACA